MKPLTANEIRGNWATVLLPINEDDSIDYARLKTEIETIIDFGVDGLYTNGSAGEFHTQNEAEFDAVNQLVSELCNPLSMPFQIGVSHMSAQISLQRLKRCTALQPSAFQVILPDWVTVNNEEAVAFLRRMVEAAAPIGLVLYNPPHAKRKLTPAEFGQIKAAVPELVGVKVAGGDSIWYQSMRDRMQGLSVFVPGHQLATGISEGAHGSYSNVACIHPLAAQKWYQLILTDRNQALDIEQRIQLFLTEQIAPFGNQGYSNPALDKLLAAMGAWSDAGTRLRWPYQYLDSGKAIELRERFLQIVPEFKAYL